MVALGQTEGWRRGRRRISGKRLRSIEILKSQGLSNRAIAQRLGINEKAIRKLVGPKHRCHSGSVSACRHLQNFSDAEPDGQSGERFRFFWLGRLRH